MLAWFAPCEAQGAPRIVAYSVTMRGDAGRDFGEFARVVQRALADPRGWSLDGAVVFKRVAGGGNFVLWLATPEAMTSFSSDCDASWSCNVGSDVVINDARFRDGSPFWNGSLDDYRMMLINHETGHWIGFDHDACPGSGELAPVMMQQSKGVGTCVGNPWPLKTEREAAARLLGLTGTDVPVRADDALRAPGFTPLP